MQIVVGCKLISKIIPINHILYSRHLCMKRKENLYEAIIDFQNRERRFGKTTAQLDNMPETQNVNNL